MNLTHKYPKTNDHLFQFVVVEEEPYERYIVSVTKWSDKDSAYQFFGKLSQETFANMFDEPDLFFNEILGNESNDVTLGTLLSEQNITFQTLYTSTRAYHQCILQFQALADADATVRVLEKYFLQYRI